MIKELSVAAVGQHCIYEVADEESVQLGDLVAEVAATGAEADSTRVSQWTCPNPACPTDDVRLSVAPASPPMSALCPICRHPLSIQGRLREIALVPVPVSTNH